MGTVREKKQTCGFHRIGTVGQAPMGIVRLTVGFTRAGSRGREGSLLPLDGCVCVSVGGMVCQTPTRLILVNKMASSFALAKHLATFHTDRSDRCLDPNLSLSDIVQDLCSTGPIQEACPRSCRLLYCYYIAPTRQHEPDHTHHTHHTDHTDQEHFFPAWYI